jgi:hypothetical protein
VCLPIGLLVFSATVGNNSAAGAGLCSHSSVAYIAEHQGRDGGRAEPRHSIPHDVRPGLLLHLELLTNNRLVPGIPAHFIEPNAYERVVRHIEERLGQRQEPCGRRATFGTSWAGHNETFLRVVRQNLPKSVAIELI